MPRKTDQITLISQKVWQLKPPRIRSFFKGKEWWGINPNYYTKNDKFLQLFAELKAEYNKKILMLRWPFQTDDQRQFWLFFFIFFF